jgi:hypothetical protein
MNNVIHTYVTDEEIVSGDEEADDFNKTRQNLFDTMVNQYDFKKSFHENRELGNVSMYFKENMLGKLFQDNGLIDYDEKLDELIEEI